MEVCEIHASSPTSGSLSGELEMGEVAVWFAKASLATVVGLASKLRRHLNVFSVHLVSHVTTVAHLGE